MSDILGIFEDDAGPFVRISRPDGSFREGRIKVEDAAPFSARWKAAKLVDESEVFDCSEVKEWEVAD
ncbi:MAG: hypothetical protein AAFO74_12960 [Pseudomonadota bacterium]